jgi:transcriptional regulator with XRE-family HTH domain
MPEVHQYLKALLSNLRKIRKKSGLKESQIEEKLILGPGWVRRFENGETIPSIEMLIGILHEIGSSIDNIIPKLPLPKPSSFPRYIFATPLDDNNLDIQFRYANFDAHYKLENAKLGDFENLLKILRDGLAKSPNGKQSKKLKTDAVADMFLAAIKQWPNANPSDIWWFIVNRAYCDPYNHPAKYARLDFSQSWKRTGGWALEEVLVRHYGPFLKKNKVNLFIADSVKKKKLIESLKLEDRVETDKIDVVLTIDTPKGEIFLGVVHVKASFAERRTDDVPLSNALKKAGYLSPLWTMDCKSSPGENPVNYGELGETEKDKRSAKRKDIEDEGYFTGCFSYNKNTEPSPTSLPEDKRIYVCDFKSPSDAFSSFILKRWEKIKSS